MDCVLEETIKSYLKTVYTVSHILVDGINALESLSLHNKRDFFEYRLSARKTKFFIGGLIYELHGKGCTAYNNEFYIDWDFGYRSRWCGINPWKIARTLKKNENPLTQFYDGSFIESQCEKSVLDGIMFKYKEQYYFNIPIEQTFRPNFPGEFNALSIEYRNNTWILQRNKTIDRFVRKSTWVYNQVDQCDDRCILRFILNGREIYQIAYSDIAYPESAVRIMSDNILNKLSSHTPQA